MGPQCAGKPQDPNNPPPNYKPWICPSSFQNSFCPSYVCDKAHFQCLATNKSNGLPYADCVNQCFPPTYACNLTSAQCYKTLPGTGVPLPDCQKICKGGFYKCNKVTYQCESAPNGKKFQECQQDCFPPIYNCSEQNKSCFVVPAGTPGGTSLPDCKARCGKKPPSAPSQPSPSAPVQKDFYTCEDDTLICKKTPHGQSLSDCNASCGNPNNVTPVNLIGDYRGLQINKGYTKGEWTMQITAAVTVIKDPSNNVWAKGTIATYAGEIWLVTSKGKYRGVVTTNQLPEVFTVVWALGQLNGPAPKTQDDAMKSGSVFSMKKCINSANCKWILSNLITNNDLAHYHHRVISHNAKDNLIVKQQKDRAINDPCAVYPDCNSCITAKDFCGWCSISVMYTVGDQTCAIPGKNCVGLNSTKIGAKFCCGPAPGVTFSTIECPTNQPPSSPPVTKAPITFPPIRPTAPVKPTPPTKPPVLYDCNPSNNTCVLSTGPNGMPLEQCNNTCNTIPDVPVILRGRKFRGLQIQMGYIVGEYELKFSETSATFTTPQAVSITAIVSQTGPYIVLNMPSGTKVFTLSQMQTDNVVDFLSWAWGTDNGPAPTSFDTSMVTTG